MKTGLLIALSLVLIACGGAQRAPLPAGACRPAANDSRPWEERGPVPLSIPPLAAPRRGAERPRVVVQAFSDFECPFCSRAVPTLERLLEDYDGCLQVVWRNRPMRYHAHAELAARAALEVHQQLGDDAFWRYHDRIFGDQANLSREQLETHAQELPGIDMEAFRAALDGNEHQDAIDRDLDTLDRVERRLGTPTFVINGRVIHGAQPYELFVRVVEDAIRDTL